MNIRTQLATGFASKTLWLVVGGMTAPMFGAIICLDGAKHGANDIPFAISLVLLIGGPVIAAFGGYLAGASDTRDYLREALEAPTVGTSN
jgi:hypothetical protein